MCWFNVNVALNQWPKAKNSILIVGKYYYSLHDTASNTVVAHYEVNRILFYARGPQGSKEQACFAFTWSHGDSVESAIFQCHVFRCHIPEAVNQVSSKHT